MIARTKITVFLAAFLTVSVLLVPTGSEGAPAAGSLQALYEAAKAEGEVVFWGSVDPEEIQQLSPAFNKRFPGIKVKHFEIGTGPAVQRIVLEARVGKISLDTLAGSLAGASPLLERDLLQGYDDWEKLFQGPGLKLNPHSILWNGKAITWYGMSWPIGYNTKLLKREEAPKTWDDVLDPKWKGGKLLVEARGKCFAYLGLKWGERKMMDYVIKIAEQKPLFTKGATTLIQQLASGEAPLGIGTYGHKIMWYARDKKAPIDFIDTTTPMGASQFNTFTIKGAKHPNAAKLFAGWLATPEALKVLEAVSFRKQLLPGSDGIEYNRLKKNNVEIIAETEETADKRADLEEKAAKALGVLK
jgi:iron(III) transport system substrate-binding protein